MAEIITYKEILASAAMRLKQAFPCTVYSNEVLEYFAKPCFFIKIVGTSSPQTLNFARKELSLVLTYFPDDADANQLHFLDVTEKVETLFQNGLKVKERFLHTENIGTDYSGENDDILQITVELPYLERIAQNKPAAEIMGSVDMNLKINESEETLWQN